MGNYKKDFNKEEYATNKKKEMDELTKKLEQGIQDVFNDENYLNYLKFCARFPRYSLNNQILIMMQCPTATRCQSFTAWKKLGRTVKRGEVGIKIFAPAPYMLTKEIDKTDANGNVVKDSNGNAVKETTAVKICAFKPAYTFDVNQTEGKPLPEFQLNELTQDGCQYLIDALINTLPIPVNFEAIESGVKGYYHIEKDCIVVKEGMSEAQTLKTLTHEAAHSILHTKEQMAEKKKSRDQKECEAESVAYIVCNHFGVDTGDYSFGYLATWSSGKELPELKESLGTIRETAVALIDRIEKALDLKLDEAC